MADDWPAWATERVEVVDWDPAWERRASDLIADLERRLSPWLAGSVEHVGSTAVPGLPGKPVVDLLAPVVDLAGAPRADETLLEAGWHLVPPELDGRPWRRMYVLAEGDRRLAHLHLVERAHPRRKAMLEFRDRLSGDPELAERYAAIKRRAASAHADDREAYTAAKSAFVTEVLASPRDPVEPPPAARRLWCELGGVSDALTPSTRTVVRGSRGICPPGWVGVVRLGTGFLVEAGDADEQTLARILQLDDPSDPEQVGSALEPSRTLGPGQLAYLPPDADVPVREHGEELEEARVATIRDWLESLPQDDVAESSIDEMDRVLVLRRQGRVVGAAGHLDWPADIAHIGIVIDPHDRGHGNALRLGAAATRRAIAAGRHPQWRAAASNEASRAAALRIGYREFGRQFSFRLG